MSTFKKIAGQWKIVCSAGGPESKIANINANLLGDFKFSASHIHKQTLLGVHDELEAVKKAAKALMAQNKYIDAFKCMYADNCVMAIGGAEPIRGREGRNNHAHIHFYSFMHISSRCGRNGKARSGRRRT